MLQISMPRGDRKTIPFKIRHKNGETDDRVYDQIYMTVKRTFNDKKCLFQKDLRSGSIESYGEGAYSFTILPEDTDDLSFGKYVFDIEIIMIEGDEIKQTFTGEFALLPECTHAINESTIISPDEPTEDNPEEGELDDE